MEIENEATLIDVAETYEPTIVVVKGATFATHGQFKTSSGTPRGLVVHYTVSGRNASSARGVVSYLASKGLGCPVMDAHGTIYIPEGYDPLRQVVYHAGDSKWKGVSGISAHCIGMEICGWGLNAKHGPFRTVEAQANQKAGRYQAYTPAQEQALINVILWLQTECPEFDIDWVVGHDEIAPTRKQDPGGSLSMTMPEFRSLLKRASPAALPANPDAKPVPVETPAGTPDYGNDDAFVRAFQKANGLKVDGFAGRKTYEKLNAS